MLGAKQSQKGMDGAKMMRERYNNKGLLKLYLVKVFHI